MNPGETIYAFDSSRQALIFDSGDGKLVGIGAKGLRQAGWIVDVAAMARELPRFGKPAIELASRMPARH